MVSTCERLINVVTTDKLKMLESLSQKAPWWVEIVFRDLSWTINATGEESGPKPNSVIYAEHGKPDIFRSR